jgi:hypothetical protein
MTKQHYNYGEAVDGGRFTCLRAMPRVHVRGVLGEDRHQHGEGRAKIVELGMSRSPGVC